MDRSCVKNALRAACIVIVLAPCEKSADVALTNSVRRMPFQSNP